MRARTIVAIAGAVVLVGAVTAGGIVAAKLSRLSERELPSDAELRAEYIRSRVALSTVPAHVYHAILAAEDPRFFERDTFTCLSFGRHGPMRKQLAYDLLPRKRWRPAYQYAIEQLMLTKLCKTFSADELLELYLGRASFVSGTTGLAQAAARLFGKTPAQLDLGEAAYLAAAVRSPTKYGLCASPAAAKSRQTYVLDRLVGLGWATATTVAPAEAAPPPRPASCR